MKNEEEKNEEVVEGNDELEKELDDFNPDTSEDVEELRKMAQSALKQKNHWRKKAQEPKQTEEIKKPTEEKVEEAKAKGIDVDTLLELQSEGHSPSDIRNLSNMAKKMGLGIESLMENETFMAGFKAQKADADATTSTPTPANRVVVHKNKTYRDIVTDDSATKEDKQRAFEEHMKNLKAGR